MIASFYASSVAILAVDPGMHTVSTNARQGGGRLYETTRYYSAICTVARADMALRTRPRKPGEAVPQRAYAHGHLVVNSRT